MGRLFVAEPVLCITDASEVGADGRRVLKAARLGGNVRGNGRLLREAERTAGLEDLREFGFAPPTNSQARSNNARAFRMFSFFPKSRATDTNSKS